MIDSASASEGLAAVAIVASFILVCLLLVAAGIELNKKMPEKRNALKIVLLAALPVMAALYFLICVCLFYALMPF